MLTAQTLPDITPENLVQLAYTMGIFLIGCVIWYFIGPPVRTWWAAREEEQERGYTRPHPRRAPAGGAPPAPFPVPVERPPAAPQVAVEVPRAELDVLADSLNVAIIGPKGSGKTTLIGRLLALRAGYVEALDPHNEPGKWPCPVVGGGLDFAGVQQRLTVATDVMRQRYAASHNGTRTQATYQTAAWRFALAGDEWGNVVAELPDVRATKDRAAVPGAGSLLGKLLTQGRKVGIGVIVAAHDDTAAQLGLGGQMGLVDCFDWLVYLGGAATSNTAIPIEVRQAARRMTRPAVALTTDHQEWFLLDTRTTTRGLDRAGWVMPQDYALAVELATPAPVSRDSAPVPLAVPRSLGDMEGTAAESEGTAGDMGTGAPPSPAEVAFIAASLSRGLTVSQTAKAMRGYNGRTRARLLAKVEYVKALLDEQGLNSPPDEGEAADEGSEAQRVTRAA